MAGEMCQSSKPRGMNISFSPIALLSISKMISPTNNWGRIYIAYGYRHILGLYPPTTTSLEVESHLQSNIYELRIRRVVWEGIAGKYEDNMGNRHSRSELPDRVFECLR
jgi:hypothetical protein